jgi:DcuC family C4-dicarboxylate transporter
MQLAATIARSISPVSAVCIAVGGLADVSTADIAKRTALPMIGAFIVMTIANLVAI